MQAVVVTGGAGYIGSHICKALRAAGFIPVVVDNLSRGHRSFVKWGPLAIGDVGNKNFLKGVFQTYSPCAVIHCAAFAYVNESVNFPSLYYRNNVVESLSLLETMEECCIPIVIFSSTCATYGEASFDSLTEQQLQRPINPYGRSKLVVEWMIKDFAKSYGSQYAILRYFNAAGADLDGEIGEFHHPETHLIPLILHAACGKIDRLFVYGNDFPTADGTAVRDFIHVSDLAQGHVNALIHLIEGGDSFELNLGSGKGSTVMEIVQEAQQITGNPVSVEIAPRREGDPAILISSIEKAKDLLRWEPRYSDRSTIIQSAWSWMHTHCYFEISEEFLLNA